MADDPTAPEPGPESDSAAAPADSAPPAAVAATPEATPPVAAGPVLPPVVPAVPDTGYTLSGVPTLEGVRDKIEARLGNALGATELAEDTPEVRTATERYEARQHAAAEKLEEIRASMHRPD
jgi:hypothetical protein